MTTPNTGTVTFQTPETTATAPDPQTARPDWQPEGFSGDQKALAKSWQDQRAEITRLQQALAGKAPQADTQTPSGTTEPPAADPATTPPTPDPAAPTTPPTADDAAKTVADKAAAQGFDVNQFDGEWRENGDIKPENRAKIAEGLKSILGENALTYVNEFIESRKQSAQAAHNELVTSAGGAERFEAMRQWAGKTLTDGELAAFNKAVTSGDKDAAALAVQGLSAKFEAAAPREPNLLRATGGSTAATVGFSSSAQMVQAMSDPRYAKDPAYRDEVARRIAASTF